MKTHDLARALAQLSEVLLSAQNTDVGKLGKLFSTIAEASTLQKRPKMDNAQAALNLSTLVAMSQLGKQQWLELIQEMGLPLEIPKAYSARDTIGKLLKFLDDNPKALEQVQRKAATAKASPELMRALAVLMGGEKK